MAVSAGPCSDIIQDRRVGPLNTCPSELRCFNVTPAAALSAHIDASDHHSGSASRDGIRSQTETHDIYQEHNTAARPATVNGSLSQGFSLKQLLKLSTKTILKKYCCTSQCGSNEGVWMKGQSRELETSKQCPSPPRDGKFRITQFWK